MTTFPLILSILSGVESDLRATIELVEKDGDMYSDEELRVLWRKFEDLVLVANGGCRAMDRVKKRNWVMKRG